MCQRLFFNKAAGLERVYVRATLTSNISLHAKKEASL